MNIRFDRMELSGTKIVLLAGMLAGAFVVSPAFSQSGSPANALAPPPAQAAGPAPAVQSAKPAVAGAQSRYQPAGFGGKAARYYSLIWGIDSVSVRAVESGELIRFSYRVLDPDKARVMNDKKTEAFLIFPEGHVKLVVPSLEKVGQLRQSNTPVAGTSYWMAFSNPHRTVKRGDWVDVVIGNFRVQGLLVE